jgi:hypothetical protein
VSPKTKRVANLVGAALSILVAFNTAAGLAGRVRSVDIVLLFATGMGAGVTLVGLVRQLRGRRGD